MFLLARPARTHPWNLQFRKYSKAEAMTFRWLTSEARSFSLRSGDNYSDYQSLDNSLHLEAEDEGSMMPRNDEERVQMIRHFHAMITHRSTHVSDVVRVLERFRFLVNDEQYLDERKSDQTRVRGVSPLRNALLYKNYGIAEALVKMGANLNVLVDHAGSQMTLLSYACVHGQIELVRAILERNERDVESAIENENDNHVGKVYRIGLLQNATDAASNGGSSRNVKEGIDVNEKDRNGNFPLLWACLFGHHNVAKVLLEHQNQKTGIADKQVPRFLSVALQTPPTSSLAQDANSQIGLDVSRSSYQASLTNVPLRQDTKHLVDVHARNEFGWNSLTCCCHSGDYELAMDLIALGVDHTKQDQLGRSPLYICCQEGHKDLALALIVLGADLNVMCKPEQSHMGMLDVAIANGHAEIAMLLMERGCAVDTVGEVTGRSPLFLAASCGLVSVAEDIIRRVRSSAKPGSKLPASSVGADTDNASGNRSKNRKVLSAVNRADASGITPLHAAVASGSMSVASLLLQNGANLTACGPDGATVLHMASQRSIGAGALVAFIFEELGRRLREGGRVDKKPSSSSPPPIGSSDQPQVTSLLEFVALKNSKGQTALHIAALNPSCGAEAVHSICLVVEALGSLEAVIDAADDSGDTPLHLACRGTIGGPAVALMERGCDITLVDITGRTALQHLLMQAAQMPSPVSLIPSSPSSTTSPEDSRRPRRDSVQVSMSSAQLYVQCVRAHVATLRSPEEALRVAESLLSASSEFNVEWDGQPMVLTTRWLLRKPSSFIESSSFRATPSRSNSYASSVDSSVAGDTWDVEKGISLVD